jgi:hypothetical protein
MPDRYYIGGEKPYASRRQPLPSKRSWPKWLRVTGWLLLTIAVLALLVGLIVYRAVKHVPEFYLQAMDVSLQEHAVASDKMERQVAGLVSDVRKEGRWTAVFSAEQINGWLAVELVKSHRELLPPSLSDPRVSIKPDAMTVACRYRSGAIDAVASLAVDVYLAEPNVVALQIRGVRAGSLPLPLGGVLDEISRAIPRSEWDVGLRWVDGDPVMLISRQRPYNPGEKVIRIDAVELEEGEIRVAGWSQRP